MTDWLMLATNCGAFVAVFDFMGRFPKLLWEPTLYDGAACAAAMLWTLGALYLSPEGE